MFPNNKTSHNVSLTHTHTHTQHSLEHLHTDTLIHTHYILSVCELIGLMFPRQKDPFVSVFRLVPPLSVEGCGGGALHLNKEASFGCGGLMTTLYPRAGMSEVNTPTSYPEDTREGPSPSITHTSTTITTNNMSGVLVVNYVKNFNFLSQMVSLDNRSRC